MSQFRDEPDFHMLTQEEQSEIVKIAEIVWIMTFGPDEAQSFK